MALDGPRPKQAAEVGDCHLWSLPRAAEVGMPTTAVAVAVQHAFRAWEAGLFVQAPRRPQWRRGVCSLRC